MYKILWNLLAPFHKAFYKLIVLSFIGEVAQMINSSFVSILVWLIALRPPDHVWWIVFIVYTVYGELSMRLDNFYDWHVIINVSHPIYKHLKLLAMEKFMNLGLMWHTQRNSGALIGQISTGVWKTMEIVDSFIWEVVPSVIQFFISAFAIGFFSLPITFACTLAIAIFFGITYFGEKRKDPIREATQDLYTTEDEISQQSVQGIETVMSYVREYFELAKQRTLHENIIDGAKKVHQIGIYWMNRWRIRDLINFKCLIYIICVNKALNYEMDTPTLIFTSTLMERMFNSLWRFAHVADKLFRNGPSIRRYLNLATEPEPLETGTVTRKIANAPVIEFNHVCTTYKDEYSETDGALHDVSVLIPAGSILAIVGRSGGGKTTFGKCVTKLHQIHGGDILIDGTSIKDWVGKSLRQSIAVVHQDSFVFDVSIKENILYGKPDATQSEIENAAKLTGIHDFIASLPKGYETVVGERGVRLSGGERQRVVFARALLPNLEILLLDEATGSLDEDSQRYIQENLEKIRQGKTCIIIAHRLSTIRMADQIIVMDKGRIAERGTREELLAQNGIYAGMEALSKFD